MNSSLARFLALCKFPGQAACGAWRIHPPCGRHVREGLYARNLLAFDPLRVVVVFAMLALSTIWPLGLYAQDEISIRIIMNQSRIYRGDSVLAEIVVRGTTDASLPDTRSLLKDFEVSVRSGDVHSTTRISLNPATGRQIRVVDSRYTHRVILTPKRIGSLVVGPVYVTIGDKTYESNRASLLVLDPEIQDDVILNVQFSRKEILPDENVTVTLHVAVRKPDWIGAQAEPLLAGSPPHLTIPWLEVDGLDSVPPEKMLQGLILNDRTPGYAINNYSIRGRGPFSNFGSFFGENRLARFRLSRKEIKKTTSEGKTKIYTDYTFQRIFTGDRLGTYEFRPVKFRGEILSEERGSKKNIYALSKNSSLRVLALPRKNKPSYFTGAIGRIRVKAHLNPTKCRIGDPLTLTLTIDGPAKLERIVPLRLSMQKTLLKNFKVYDETSAGKIEGNKKIFTHTLRPVQAGSYNLPPLDLAYFDLASRSYKTVQTKPIRLQVEDAEAVGARDIQSPLGLEQTDIASLEGSLLANREDESLLQDEAFRPASLSWIWWMALCLPLIDAIFWIYLRFLSQRGRDVIGLRRRRARGRALRTLSKAERIKASGSRDKILGTLSEAMSGFVSDLCGLSSTSPTIQETQSVLLEKGHDADLVAAYSALMEICEEGRFSTHSVKGLGKLLSQARDLIGKLDKSKAKL